MGNSSERMCPVRNEDASEWRIWLKCQRCGYSLQLRWRPLAPRKAALAALRAADMPVRRPRRPAAASASVVAGAEPQIQLRRLPRAR